MGTGRVFAQKYEVLPRNNAVGDGVMGGNGDIWVGKAAELS